MPPAIYCSWVAKQKIRRIDMELNVVWQTVKHGLCPWQTREQIHNNEQRVQGIVAQHSNHNISSPKSSLVQSFSTHHNLTNGFTFHISNNFKAWQIQCTYMVQQDCEVTWNVLNCYMNIVSSIQSINSNFLLMLKLDP